jgi:hypothetical protein
MSKGEQQPSKEPEEDSPRSEERVRVIKDYANDLWETLRKLRELLR